jgi:hypothetical protein
MLRRNMLTADCQNSEVQGKILGLHSTVFQSAAMETRDLTAEITAKTPKIACNWSSWASQIPHNNRNTPGGKSTPRHANTTSQVHVRISLSKTPIIV